MVIGIIGGGASGMAAALAAASVPGTEVVLMERQARLGRKLRATGNGRCNLTNLHAGERGYHGNREGFWEEALRRFSPEETLGWFREMGLFTTAEPSGRVYPYSDQANSVADVLRFALDQPHISRKLGFAAEKVRVLPSGFRVESREDAVSCDRLIVACGGLAGTGLGGSMSGYQLLRSLGHRCTRLRPNLVQLRSDWGALPSLKGVRANCRVSVLHDGTEFAGSRGEIQFTEYGLSGPVIFEVSRDVCQGVGSWVCRLDFLPETEEKVLERELLRRKTTELPASELFTGILHNRLGRVLTAESGIGQAGAVREIPDAALRLAARIAKQLDVTLKEPMGMDAAQVTAGGICTEEFDEKTMESKLVPGLYACGEVLDVDGDCGGYNLQWAWSSGRLAGFSAGRKEP